MIRTLYLQRSLSVNWGSGLGSRRAWSAFQAAADEWALAHCVMDHVHVSRVKEADVRRDVMTHEDLDRLDPTLIVMEEGPFLNSGGDWRLDPELVEERVKQGACLLVTDVHLNEVHEQLQHYTAFATLLGARIEVDKGGSPASLRVVGTGDRTLRCNPEKMFVSEWLMPVYEGIREIVASHALLIDVTMSWHVLASGNRHTTMPNGAIDNWDMVDPCPFASVRQVGDGYIIFIAARVSTDRLADGTDNIAWLLNVANFLQMKAAANRMVSASARSSAARGLAFLSHRSTDDAYVAAVASDLRRHGVGVWLDDRELTLADSLSAEIGRALGSMTHFVLFWSSRCLGSRWVERELNSAVSLLVDQDIPIVIVRLDETPVPPVVSDLIRLDAWHLSPEQVAARLADALERRSRRGKR